MLLVRATALTVAALASLGRASAQPTTQLQLADRGPTFYDVSGPRPIPVDVTSIPVLRQRIALHLDDTPLFEALLAVARVAHAQILYSRFDVPENQRVTLVASKITVA